MKVEREALSHAIATFNGDAEGLLKAMGDWWKALKAWEGKETFNRAFGDSRMTARILNFETVHTPLTMTQMSSPSSGKVGVGGKSDTGIKGLMLRLEPKSFIKDVSRESSKYDLGLHDMSSSLLHPKRPIDVQLYGHQWKEQSHAKTVSGGKQTRSFYVVFMPVAETADMALFAALNDFCKRFKGQGEADKIYQKVRDYRSEFTRIKFADKDDSHIGFVDVSTDSARKKFRYGLSDKDARAGSIDTETMRLRKAAALMYTGILETAQERALRKNSDKVNTKFYNEIIVSYRKHASGKFPIFARWLKGENCFQVVVRDGAGMKDAAGQKVSNDGQSIGF